MAILKNGINGSFSGKVGNVVGYELHGQMVIRSLPKGSIKKPTHGMIQNRNRFKVVSQFLAPIKGIVQFGYKNLSPPGSKVGSFQMAQGYHLKHALANDAPDTPYIQPDKVMIFRGALPPLLATEVQRNDNILHILWDANLHNQTYQHVLLFVYDLEKEWAMYEGNTSAKAGAIDWVLPSHLSTIQPLHVYIAVLDVLSNEMSDSSYAGWV